MGMEKKWKQILAVAVKIYDADLECQSHVLKNQITAS